MHEHNLNQPAQRWLTRAGLLLGAVALLAGIGLWIADNHAAGATFGLIGLGGLLPQFGNPSSKARVLVYSTVFGLGGVALTVIGLGLILRANDRAGDLMGVALLIAGLSSGVVTYYGFKAWRLTPA